LKKALRFTDAEMLRGLVSGNDDILRAYYKFYYSGIRRYVLINHGKEEDAKDLFQDVLLVVFQKVRSNSFELSCSLNTFLFSISKLLWLKELDKRKKVSYQIVISHELCDSGKDIIEIAEYNERLQIYRRHFEKLSANCRMVLSLFIDGKSISEITTIMGYKSDQYTKNRRYKCKLTLIQRIKGIYNYEDTN